VIKNQVLQSKQMGRRENKFVNFEGRVPFDLLLVIIVQDILVITSINDIFMYLI
jgi:hypothetical protein